MKPHYISKPICAHRPPLGAVPTADPADDEYYMEPDTYDREFYDVGTKSPRSLPFPGSPLLKEALLLVEPRRQ